MKRYINIYTDEMVTQTEVFIPKISKFVSYRKDNPVIIPTEIKNGKVTRVIRKYNFSKLAYIFFLTHKAIN